MQENLKRQLFGYDNMNMQATYSLTKNYRVLCELRAMKHEAYTPRMFSIGPLHRDKSELQNMQKEKRRYMSHFFDRLVESNKGKFQIIGESSENSNHILARNKCFRVVMELEEEARACYAEDINLDKHQFAEMLLLDACFILELFYRCKLISIQNHNDESYPIDSLAHNVPMVQILRNDLMLLENQIPYFVLQKLFDLVPGPKKVSIGIPDMSLGEHIFCFFNSVPMLQHKCLNFKDGTYRHLLDMLSHVCKVTPSMISSNYSHHNWGITRCATELLKSGIQIRCDHSKVMLDIKFNNGEISIPQVIIDKSSDILLRNLIALEQTSTGRHLVTSYVKIMSTLIRSPKDAYLLEQLGIISKSDVEMDASAFFKSLCKGVVFVDFCFTDLCKEVNDFQIPVWKRRRLKGYFRIKCVEWKESIEDLRQEYFRNRWRSTVTVFGLLQTFYAICSNYPLVSLLHNLHQ